MDSQFLNTEEDIIKKIQSVTKLSQVSYNTIAGITYQRSQKVKVFQSEEEELKQIYYLIDSHVKSLRRKTADRYERLLEKCSEDTMSQLHFLKNIFATDQYSKKNINKILKQLLEMPKEWTLIHLTSQYNSKEDQNIDVSKPCINGLHITVLNCGQDEIKPFLITLNDPRLAYGELGLIQEFLLLIAEYENEILKYKKSRFNNRDELSTHWLKRERNNYGLKTVLDKIEIEWLKEWRCLFIGKYQDERIETFLNEEIDKFFMERDEISQIADPKKKYILRQLVKSVQYLEKEEIKNMVKYCCNNSKDLEINDVCCFMVQLDNVIRSKYKNHLTNPIILIIDEELDIIPWEMMKIVTNESISRLPSFHFAYMLFKTYEQDIENGYKIIKNYQNGQFLTDPDCNLEKMRKRMVSFYNYWMPQWKGIIGIKPTEDDFSKMLTCSDIFLYNGHGSGAHLVALDLIQKIEVTAVVCLFGCSSTQIKKLGPQVETYSTHYFYLIAKCPCLLGMLWIVTDAAVDTLTSEFLSIWIPSETTKPWSSIDKKQWKQGVSPEKCTVPNSQDLHKSNRGNLELVRALNKAKDSAQFFTTKAACIVRGLPTKIKLLKE